MTTPRTQGFLPGRHSIDSYTAGGFRFAGMSHRGSLLALPSGIHALAATDPGEVDAAALAALFAEPAGAVELLIIGSGAHLVPVAAPLAELLRLRKIRFDPMATPLAISTYNILLGEGRRVAAALLAVD